MPREPIARPGPDEYAPFYASYIARVPETDILQVLASEMEATLALLRSIPEERAGHRYADGKWSIREVVGHLADTERVMSYRALCIARGDATPLPGFDENRYVEEAHFDRRALPDLSDELEMVRRATLGLFGSLPDEAWQRRGTANQAEISVRALAYIIAGHELHHRNLLVSRYLSPVAEPGRSA
jgi:hypothetical protein